MTSSQDSYHIVVLGEPWTGKQSFCERLQQGTFSETKVGVPGNQFFTIPLSRVCGSTVTSVKQKLTIDKVGMPAFVGHSGADFVPSRPSVDAIVVLVSVCDYMSMTAIEKWRQFAERTCKDRLWRGTALMVLSTFCDKPKEERLVLPGEVDRAAEERGYQHAEISNKTGAGIRTAMMTLVKSIMDAKGQGGDKQEFEAVWETELAEAKQEDEVLWGSSGSIYSFNCHFSNAFPSNNQLLSSTQGQHHHENLQGRQHASGQLPASSPSSDEKTFLTISSSPSSISQTPSNSAKATSTTTSTTSPIQEWKSAAYTTSLRSAAAATTAIPSNPASSEPIPIVVVLSRDSSDSSGATTPDLPLLRFGLPDNTNSEKKRFLSPGASPREPAHNTSPLNPVAHTSTPVSHDSLIDCPSPLPHGASSRDSAYEIGDSRSIRRHMLTEISTREDSLLEPEDPILSPRSEARRSLKLRRLINTSRSPPHSREPSSSSIIATDRPKKQPTKIEFQKDAVFDSKKRHLIISGDTLFIYKHSENRKLLFCTVELVGATTKRPKEGSLKVKFFAEGSCHTIKFSDEGSLALFRGKVQNHARQAKRAQTMRESASWIVPVFSTVVAGRDALMLLQTNEENCYCAECSADNPEYAVANLGVVVCEECSKIHRLLSIPNVQVVKIDEQPWNPFLLDMMMFISNDVANSIWEENLLKNGEHGICLPGLPEKPLDESPFHVKSAFIHAKYEQRAFLEPDYLGSLLNMDDALPNMGLNVALKIAASQPKHLSSLVRFLAHDISSNSALDSQTILHVACSNGNYLAVMLLLQNGADPNAKDSFASVPLDLSVEFDRAASQFIDQMSRVPRDLLMLCGDDPDFPSTLDLEWPNASSVLIDYGAVSRPAGMIVNKKTEASSEASSRPASLKAAMVLGLLDNPDKPTATSSLRLSSSRVPPSLSPEVFRLATSLNRESPMNSPQSGFTSSSSSGAVLSTPSSPVVSPRSLVSSIGEISSFMTRTSDLSPPPSPASASFQKFGPDSPSKRVSLAQTAWKSSPHVMSPRQTQGREQMLTRRGRRLDLTATSSTQPGSPGSSSPTSCEASQLSSDAFRGPQSSPSRAGVLAGTD